MCTTLAPTRRVHFNLPSHVPGLSDDDPLLSLTGSGAKRDFENVSLPAIKLRRRQNPLGKTYTKHALRKVYMSDIRTDICDSHGTMDVGHNNIGNIFFFFYIKDYWLLIVHIDF